LTTKLIDKSLLFDFYPLLVCDFRFRSYLPEPLSLFSWGHSDENGRMGKSLAFHVGLDILFFFLMFRTL